MFSEGQEPRGIIHTCLNNEMSDEPSWWEHDYQGIPLCRVCDDCRETKLARYRPEILTGYAQGGTWMRRLKLRGKRCSAPPSKDTDPRHLCFDCKVDTIDRARTWDYYMVRDDLWQAVGVGTDMLCLGCFAQRLGRPLEGSDFTLAPINRINPLVRVLVDTAH